MKIRYLFFLIILLANWPGFSSAQIIPSDFTDLKSQILQVPEQFKTGVFSKSKTLNLPEGFEISVFATGMTNPRAMVLNGAGNIFLTDMGAGKVLLVKDENNDGIADRIITVDQNLNNPHGIDLFKNDLYVAEENDMAVYRGITTEGTYSKKEILINNLPSGGEHVTRAIKIGPDEKIYIAVGASCNDCEEKDSRRAAILRYNLDGSFDRIVAKGLRNTVDFIFQRNDDNTFQIIGVDNGRDHLGDNLPPDEVNIIDPNGQNVDYGWPYCYGSGMADPNFSGKETFCSKETKAPVYDLPAHSAPLGLVQIPDSNSNWPASFGGNLLIAYHGSWNRSVPTGYKIVRVDQHSYEIYDFITGWFQNGKAWGRPVNVQLNNRGELFISDDKAGAIYLVKYKPNM